MTIGSERQFFIDAPAVMTRYGPKEMTIPYTDFPLESVEVWAQNNGQGFTLMLPSEY
jgi:hypothetical protein